MKPIKILLVIEVPLIANVFASVLDDEPDIEVAASLASLGEALAFLQEGDANVAVVSIGLPDQGALTLTREIKDRAPSTRVLVLGLSEEDKNNALRYIEAGVAGYILKDSSLKEFLEIIRLAQKGEAWVSTKMAGAMMERLFRLARMFSAVEHKMDEDARLTAQELEVL
ncbi:MAG: response regulator [Anaerolineales bacterium]